MRKGYGALVLSLVITTLLAFADSAAAQSKTKSSRSTGRSSVARVSTRTQSRSNSSPRARAVRTTSRTLRVRPTAQARSPRNTVRVNVAPATGNRGTSGRYARSPARDAKRGTRTTDRGDYAMLFRRRTSSGGRDARDERSGRRYRERENARDNLSGQRYRDGYGRGYDRGYDRGYHRGYHRGRLTGSYYLHNHYYGPRSVYGFHYGGFGFYAGRWHFAIVIGTPVYVDYRNRYYRYNWWDGRGASLVAWDDAVQRYPANYGFDLTRTNCVSLWIRTVDDGDYVIRADPRYWGARDPGDLYAQLWAELQQEGRLQVEDVNGAVTIFPAGMIQQIEVTACR